MVITFQKIVLIPKSKWIRAIKEVQTNKSKEHLSDKLYRLIGKLKSHGNQNTKDISIPDQFIISNIVPDDDWITPETLTREDELVLIDMLMNIVADEDIGEELLELLCISDSMDNVEVALLYTKFHQF